jgi:hypothetical protein
LGRKRLYQKLLLLQERKEQLKATRTKHVSLQEVVQDSLTKSRERLARLTSLVEEDVDDEFSSDDDDDAGINTEGTIEIIEPQESMQLDEEEEKEEEGEDSYSSQEEENQAMSTNGPSHEEEEEEEDLQRQQDPLVLTTPLVDMHTMEALEDFSQTHHTLNTSSNRSSLWTFLPMIGPELMEEIMILSIREANALDVLSTEEPTARRSLLWNTCLDFVLLSSRKTTTTTNHKALISTSVEDEDQKDDNNNTMSVDPNVTLCPYELAGVCADDLCPYQHTTTKWAMLPRERLPLPPLNISSTGSITDHRDDHKAPQPKGRDDEEEHQDVSKPQSIEESSSTQKDVVDLTDTATTQDGPSTEDFICLPTVDYDSDDDEDEIFEDAEDDDGEDKSQLYGLEEETKSLPPVPHSQKKIASKHRRYQY